MAEKKKWTGTQWGQDTADSSLTYVSMRALQSFVGDGKDNETVEEGTQRPEEEPNESVELDGSQPWIEDLLGLVEEEARDRKKRRRRTP